MSSRAAVALFLALAGRAAGQAPIPPAYTQEELAERCARTGGWWRPSSPRHHPGERVVSGSGSGRAGPT